MRGEDQLGPGRNASQRLADTIRHRAEEPRVMPVGRDLANLRSALAHFQTRGCDVVLILSAARIGTESRRGQRHGLLDAVIPHPPHGVRQHRMPVAIAPINRQRRQPAERLDQRPHLVVDRALAIEVIVVSGHGQQPLARNPAPARDVLEEGKHVFPLLRPAEAHHQHRVV